MRSSAQAARFATSSCFSPFLSQKGSFSTCQRRLPLSFRPHPGQQTITDKHPPAPGPRPSSPTTNASNRLKPRIFQPYQYRLCFGKVKGSRLSVVDTDAPSFSNGRYRRRGESKASSKIPCAQHTQTDRHESTPTRRCAHGLSKAETTVARRRTRFYVHHASITELQNNGLVKRRVKGNCRSRTNNTAFTPKGIARLFAFSSHLWKRMYGWASNRHHDTNHPKCFRVWRQPLKEKCTQYQIRTVVSYRAVAASIL